MLQLRDALQMRLVGQQENDHHGRQPAGADEEEPPEKLPVASLIQPVAQGPMKPARLPSALIMAIPAAAPERKAVGRFGQRRDRNARAAPLDVHSEFNPVEFQALRPYNSVRTKLYTREQLVRWVWDPKKDRENRRKHKLPLSLGEVVLADPLHLSRADPHPDGDRWNTLGEVNGVVLFAVHTWPEDEDGEGRIISVRKATARERRAYEDG